MGHSSFGKAFTITSFGESHGPVTGVVIDGCPPGVPIDIDYLQTELSRRRPGQSAFTTQRNEQDVPEILSGVFEGKSTGHPIAILIPNKDARSGDYHPLKDVYRPSHADFTYAAKYGIRDYRGGGRASARITAGWVAAGAIAGMFLRQIYPELKVYSYVSSIYDIDCPVPHEMLDLSLIDASAVRCPHPETARAMEDRIAQAREEQDSLGGVITTLVHQVPVGLGEPVFYKLNAVLAQAMLGINAVKGFEIGGGFEMARRKGSEVNDAFVTSDHGPGTSSNFSGGIQGGISNGAPLVFRTAFKPTASIGKAQNTIDTAGNPVSLQTEGRHDPCVLPRAVPIVDAMTRLVLADFVLLNGFYQHV